MNCPRCGSGNVVVNTFQENQGSVTTARTTSKYRQKGHGCLWWLLIGWWWWIVDLFTWICFFIPRLILHLFAAPFKRKKYTGRSSTVSSTMNRITYRTVCTCQNCGHSWSE